MYQRIHIATLTPLGEAAPLPAELDGLADDTLRDLTALAEQVPQYVGVGFWPVRTEVGEPEGRVVDAVRAVVVRRVQPAPADATRAILDRLDALAAELAGLRLQVEGGAAP